jgi:hypothetical protein
MALGSAGLIGTMPSAIAELSCASLLTYVYAGRLRSRTAPIRGYCGYWVLWVLGTVGYCGGCSDVSSNALEGTIGAWVRSLRKLSHLYAPAALR